MLHWDELNVGDTTTTMSSLLTYCVDGSSKHSSKKTLALKRRKIGPRKRRNVFARNSLYYWKTISLNLWSSKPFWILHICRNSRVLCYRKDMYLLVITTIAGSITKMREYRAMHLNERWIKRGRRRVQWPIIKRDSYIHPRTLWEMSSFSLHFFMQYEIVCKPIYLLTY